jgi:outer membrane receptor protein involved in Fe transport
MPNFWTACAILLSLSPLPAAELRVLVRDPAGAPMSAALQLTGMDTRLSRGAQAPPSGEYTFTDLTGGRYRLRVSASGFLPRTVELSTGAPQPYLVQLALAPRPFVIEVVDTTPLPGVDTAADDLPTPVQAVTSDFSTLSTDLWNRRLRDVHLNEMQGNPFQADLNYRGYTASPLLGTPQGLSVYLDGVRLNQPFGDVVSWDLLPDFALSEATLMPGSNPLFGLNTLGGALSMRTKDGRNNPGATLQLSGGSFGRKVADLEYGGSGRYGLSWYAAGSLFFEDGWRQASPSNVRRLFGRLDWRHQNTTLGLTVAHANNDLTGNGLQEARLLAADYSSIYTKPDTTANRSPFVNLSLRHVFSPDVSVSGNAYFRSIRTRTLNGDINEDALDQSVYQPSAADIRALTAAGYTGFPTSGANASNTPFPFWRCIAQSLQRDEPAEKCNGLINRTATDQQQFGAAGQVSWKRLTVGAATDHGRINFGQSTQLGYLTPDRGVIGVDSYGDGVTGGDVDGEPFDTRVDLRGRVHTGSVYATSTFHAARLATVTLSGRFNATTIDNRDRLLPAGEGSLTGRHQFRRFNPAAGLVSRPFGGVTGFFNYSEGSRAPTSVELGCADPDQPCRLPNAMAGDPPLRQVVTRSVEAGLRGSLENNLHWTVSWFQARNRDDILFVASPQTGYGYFKNFGRTRRQGVEAGLDTRWRQLTIGGGYTLLAATFQSPEQVNGQGNSASDAEAPGLEGQILIQPGDHIPLIPKHMLKSYAEWQASARLVFDASLTAFSRSYARGNENNLHHPDGRFYLGEGYSPGYAVTNLGARWELHRRAQLFLRVNNVFDRRYYSGAQLGAVGFAANGSFQARPFPAVDGEYPLQYGTFLAPGAPRGIWAGIRFRL